MFAVNRISKILSEVTFGKSKFHISNGADSERVTSTPKWNLLLQLIIQKKTSLSGLQKIYSAL
jgi:hypothetical protein